MDSFYIILILMVSVMLMTSHKSDGCFENNKVLDPLWVWIQPLSLHNRLYYHLAITDSHVMTAESELNLPKYVKRTYHCLEEYEGNRMMVQVQENGGKIQFQCLMFESLTPVVVRQSKTQLRALKKKVDCKKEKYLTDEAVMVALGIAKPQHCPLQGGYQIILHEGEIIRGHCMESSLTYNPSLRFQCDKYNVIADFGRDCEPPILRESQKMRRRHIAHLSCIGSWDEKGNIKSLLLRMRDQPYTLWCIHYRQTNSTSEFLSVFMTLDGRCVKDSFHDEDFPKKSSMFGQLVSYTASDDPRCSETEYLDQCNNDGALCFDNDECPANCKRCNVKPSKSACRFMEDTHGHWTTVNSRPEMTVDVVRNSFQVSRYGEFSCHAEADRSLPGRVYPVVQSSDLSSCLPFYACAQVLSPVPGVLNFNLRPAWRDEDSGEPFTCKQTFDKVGSVIPVEDERTITMINSEKLEKSPCHFHTAHKFPTVLETCLLEVDECGSDCSSLTVRFDNETCRQQEGFPINTELDCYARFRFTDGINGLLTYSSFSDRYFCWIYTSSRLFIASPADCNSERVNRIFADSSANERYDPANALSRPISDKSSGDNGRQNNFEMLCHNKFVFLLFCLLSILNQCLGVCS